MNFIYLIIKVIKKKFILYNIFYFIVDGMKCNVCKILIEI